MASTHKVPFVTSSESPVMYGPATAVVDDGISVHSNSHKANEVGLTVDELSKVLVRCRETPALPMGDRYDGDPHTYHQFIRRVEDRILGVYAQSDPGHALQLLALATKGRAHRIVNNHMMNPSPKIALSDALLELKTAFGSPLRTVNALLQRLRKGPVVRTTADGLEDFHVDLMTIRQGMLAAGAEDDLNATATIEAVFWRFPPELRKRFVRFTVDRGYQLERVPFDEVLSFVGRCKTEASSTFGRLLEGSQYADKNYFRNAGNKRAGIRPARSQALVGESGTSKLSTNTAKYDVARKPRESKLCECGRPMEHALWKCSKFQSLSIADRFAQTKAEKRCYNCLSLGHQSKDCKSTRRCSTCSGLHHTLLHRTDVPADNGLHSTDIKENGESATTASAVVMIESDNVISAHTMTIERARTRLKVLPVCITNPKTGACSNVLALLDGGSDTHLISRQLYDELGLDGVSVCSRLCMADGNTRVCDTFETSFEIQGLRESQSFTLSDVHVVDKLSDLRSSIPTEDDFQRYPYLSDVDIPIIDRENVDLLIGLNYRMLHEIIDKREAGEDQLCAGRTVLGWFLYGTDSDVRCPTASSHPCHVTQVGDPHLALLDTMKHYSLKEEQCPTCGSVREVDESDDPDVRAPSINDDRAMKIMNDSCILAEGNYQIALPWVADNPELPDNRVVAVSRLNSLGRRLKSDPDTLAKYNSKINEMIELGHAVELNSNEQTAQDGKVWYIPHHHTKTDKFRIVFDASSRFEGTTLNEKLLQGPNNTNSLFGVLLRFRLHEFAFVADIKSMFYQVRVRPSDRCALRFLYWTDGDPDKPIKTYEMTVHAFGLTSSPSVAGFALLRTAEDNQSCFSDDAVKTVRQNFYVDDLLKSCETSEAAEMLIKELNLLLSCGGFTLMKFCSNYPEILKDLSHERVLPHVNGLDLQFDTAVQKTLGILWIPSSDLFCVTSANSDHALSRRGLLSYLSRWYDPLGIVAPFLLPAKLILRNLSKLNLDWDDVNLPHEEKARWSRWESSLSNLDGITLPRCLSGYSEAETTHLHCFCDASKVAYGYVIYLLTRSKDDTAISFVVGKSKLLPAECTTTPRAELHAADEAAKFLMCVSRELNCKFDSVVFWSDSQTVLGYLKNPAKRLPVFEANRVKRILRITKCNQWRWVDTKRNPADPFSRGVSPCRVERSEEWLTGPKFLLESEENWPSPVPAVDVDNDCLCNSDVFINACADASAQSASNTIESDILSDRLIAHYSSLPRLVRATARWLRVRQILFNRISPEKAVTVDAGPITASEYEIALTNLIRIAQRAKLAGVLNIIVGKTAPADPDKRDKRGNNFRPLLAYCPFVDDDGVVRVGGRLQRSELPHNVKHPVVLPRRHHLTGLIVLETHRKCGHFANNYVANELMKTYHVMGGKRTVKHYIRSLCMTCRNRNANPAAQLMAPLPMARVEAGNRPYTNTAVDYFGPVLIKQGRNELKRYGCIFTCLATRAIHLEVAEDLTTEAFLMAYRRFLALTGEATRVMFSDNGSNFVGAYAELRRGLTRLNKNRITASMACRGVNWKFNPPLASHQGGIWESMIRLVRKTMVSLMEDERLRTLTDKGLETLFREVQLILNSRPITRVSSDPSDPRALSPLSILTGYLDPVLPPDVFIRSDGMRSSWRASQLYAEEFWKRWSMEYLTLLQKRMKWLQPQRNFKIGDFVLVHGGDTMLRWSYEKAIVVDVFPDKFGQVRRVSVRDASGKTYDRDVRKLCLLEGDLDESVDLLSVS